MFSLLALPRYHTSVLWVYLALCALVFLYIPEVFTYSVNPEYFQMAVAITVVCTAVFFIFRRYLQKRSLDTAPKTCFAGILHGTLFAFPEEVLFRGVIQTIIAMLVVPSVLVVFLSALIFGAVHLPNGATGLYPKHWNWEFFFVAFLGGIPLGTLFLITESLFFPTLLHILFLIVGRVTPRE